MFLLCCSNLCSISARFSGTALPFLFVFFLLLLPEYSHACFGALLGMDALPHLFLWLWVSSAFCLEAGAAGIAPLALGSWIRHSPGVA